MGTCNKQRDPHLICVSEAAGIRSHLVGTNDMQSLIKMRVPSLFLYIAFLALMTGLARADGTVHDIRLPLDRPSDYWLASGEAQSITPAPSGGLVDLPPGRIGWFEFDFATNTSGWRRLVVDGAADLSALEMKIDGPLDRPPAGPRMGNLTSGDWIWINKGTHRFTIIANDWRGFPKVRSVTLSANTSDEPAVFHLLRAEGGATYRVGACDAVVVLGGGTNRAFALKVRFKSGSRSIGEKTVAFGATPLPIRKEVSVPCAEAGDVLIEIEPAAQRYDRIITVRAWYSVFDTQPTTPTVHLGKLVAEIDAAAQLPDYNSGSTRVVRRTDKAYRESSDVGTTRYVRFQAEAEPSWFAYRVSGLQAGRAYLIDCEYPDDETRTFVIAYRSATDWRYSVSIGAETGGIWPTSGRSARKKMLIWAASSEGRIIIYNVHDGLRAAISTIRIHTAEIREVKNEPAPASGRQAAEWLEEGNTFRSIVGIGNENHSVYAAVTRYLTLVKLMGANTVIPSVVVYDSQLYPSRFNLTFLDRSSPDVTSAFLLQAEHYGMRVLPEINPRADELLWPARTPTELRNRLAVSSRGEVHYKRRDGSINRPPFFNAISPPVRKWYLNVVGELAERYKGYSSFAGVQLRVSDWQNPALNNFVSLDWGYDAATVRKFTQDVHISFPNDLLYGDDPVSVEQRSKVLLSVYRQKWIAWRCERIRDLLQEIVHRVRGARRDLVVQLGFFALAHVQEKASDRLREMGLDLKLLRKIDGLNLIDMRFQYGAKESSIAWQRAAAAGFASQKSTSLLRDRHGQVRVIFPMQYIEITDRVSPPDQLELPPSSRGVWISAPSEPSGRFSLMRYAKAVGRYDTCMLGNGGNGYVSSDGGIAEFLKEYSALPCRPFHIAEGVSSNLVVRTSGNIFYIVNASSTAGTAYISVSGSRLIKRLISQTPVRFLNHELVVRIDCYQLLAFEADRTANVRLLRYEPKAGSSLAECSGF